MGHEEYREMLYPGALGALEAADLGALAAHLSTCAECRAELDGWHETAAMLAFAAAPVDPPAALRARILENARLQPARGETVRDDDAFETITNETSPAPSNVVPFRRPSRRAWNTPQVFGAVAAALAFVSMLTALVIVWQRNRTLQAEVTKVSSRLNQTEEELARERQMRDEFITAPDARVTELEGTSVAPQAHARFAYNRKTGRAMLIAYDLPPAPAGTAYQLWFIADGKPPMPGGTFTPDTKGRAMVNEQVPDAGRGASTFAVTLEPQFGASSPSGKTYLSSSNS